MKQFYLLILLSVCWGSTAFSQSDILAPEPINFTERTTLLSNPQFRSVLITGVGDVNQDGLDDIIRLNRGRELEYQIQLPNQEYETTTVGTIADKPQYSMALADLDGNGQNDLLVAGNGDGVKLFLNGSGQASLLPQSIFFAQGSNIVDINGDGYLDIFVNNDTSFNRIWLNDGQANFSPASGLIPLARYQPDSLNGGNYAAVWTDIDNDRDLDCYIAKCFTRPLPDDPRLINQLFLNEGTDGYREVGKDRGLDSEAQSWTADFQDIDNDGDMDCFLLNHYTNSELLINDGTGHFTAETAVRGIRISLNYFQTLLRDFDNDGWMDLLVAGPLGYAVYQNLGNGSFERQRNVFTTYPMGTFAVGDLNHDGYLDVYSASANIAFADKLWVNEQNEKNHFLGISLEGKTPYLNAIGARIYLYGDWGIQTREIRAGESYGITNSLNVHFGLGETTVVDSLRIDWPDGTTERYESITGDQYIHIVQGDCLYPDQQIRVEGSMTLCEGESTNLIAPLGMDYQWSDGHTKREHLITEPGAYQVTVTGEKGCSRVSRMVHINREEIRPAEINVVGPTTFCEGESVLLIAPDDLSDFRWSDGSLGSTLEVNHSGEFTLEVIGRCGTVLSEPVITNRIDAPALPLVRHDTLSAPGNVSLHAQGDQLRWYDQERNLIARGAQVIVPVEETDTFYVSSTVEEAGLLCESELVPVYVVLDTGKEEEDPQETTLRIFPNPTHAEIQIYIPRKWANTLASFYSAEGRLLREVILVTGPNVLSIADLPAGIYFITFQSGVEQERRRIVKW